jgi:transposase
VRSCAIAHGLAADAEAICEAVARPNIRFVPIKTCEQQAILALHRVRALLVRQRTAAINAARGLLSEFGVVAAQGSSRVVELRERVEKIDTDLLAQEAREAIFRLFDHTDGRRLAYSRLAE